MPDEGILARANRPPGLARNHLVGRIGALIHAAAIGEELVNSHSDWLCLRDEQRDDYYRRAEQIISEVADHLLTTAGRRTTKELVAED
jgi:hypothetical protein